MATSEVSICNQALAAVGSTGFITDLAEQSAEAQLCSLFYEAARDATLEAFPWPFATRFAALAQLSTTRPNWGYVYALPADFLAAQGLVVDGARTVLPMDRIPHEFVDDGAGLGRVLCCDEHAAQLRYTARIKAVSGYPPLFVEALALGLAAKVAFPLTKNRQVLGDVLQQWQAALDRARASMLSQGHADPEPDPEWISGR